MCAWKSLNLEYDVLPLSFTRNHRMASKEVVPGCYLLSPCLQHSVFTGKFSDAMRICCHFSAALLRCLIGVTAPENRTFAWPWARAIRTPQTPSRCGEKGWTLPHPRACAFYPPSFIRRGLPFHSIHPPHYRQACLGH
jgi:hypothetical protein